MKRRYFALGAALIVPLLAAGCGFALKGQTRLPFSTIFLAPQAQGPVAQSLRRYLQDADGAQLLQKPEQLQLAQLVLSISQDEQDRRVVNTDANGLVREVQLRTRFTFSAATPAGREVIAPVELNQKRDLTYNEGVVLSKEGEEQLLYEAMREDIAQQVLRRLAAASL